MTQKNRKYGPWSSDPDFLPTSGLARARAERDAALGEVAELRRLLATKEPKP